MARGPVLEGVFAIDKPMGMSSAQVIRDCQTHFNPSTFFRPLIQQEAEARMQESNTARRRRSRAKRDMRVKMGHGGTLDPLATGVLILGVGRGTKQLNRFLQCTKTYETVVLFGASTDTYDRVGRILQRRPYDTITREAVEQALAGFRGVYRQMPPLFSALKMNGKPLYEYAREGLPLPREIETREVHVSALELVEWYEPGQHPHRWPAEEAGAAEQALAQRVWRMEEAQAATDGAEGHEQEADAKRPAPAPAQDETQDAPPTSDRPTKRQRRQGNGGTQTRAEPSTGPEDDQFLMSGALGERSLSPSGGENRKQDGVAAAPAAPAATAQASPRANGRGGSGSGSGGGRGSNLVPAPPGPNTPPPWEGKGPPAARIRMTVSSGFYVRSFCHDLGAKLGSAAMMAELARTRQADFRTGTDSVLAYADLARGEAVWAPQVARLLQAWEDGTVGQPEGGAVASAEEAQDGTAPADADADADAVAAAVAGSPPNGVDEKTDEKTAPENGEEADDKAPDVLP